MLTSIDQCSRRRKEKYDIRFRSSTYRQATTSTVKDTSDRFCDDPPLLSLGLALIVTINSPSIKPK